MRIVRDVPVTPRPRRGKARRLRPRGGHPALPGVRVPDADRSAAGAGRRIARRRRRPRCARSARAARSRLPRSPVDPEGWGPAQASEPTAAGRRAAGDSLLGAGRRTAARDGLLRGGGRPSRRTGDSRDGRRRTRSVVPADRAIAVPSGDCRDRARCRDRRSRRGRRSSDTAAIDGLAPWLAAQVRGRRRADPRRSAPARAAAPCRSPWRRPTDAVVAAEGPEASDALGGFSSGSTCRSSAHEVKPLLVDRIAADPSAPYDASRLRHPDRRVHPQRVAAQPDDRRRLRGAAGPDPAAAGRRTAGRRHARASRRSARSRCAIPSPSSWRAEGPRPPLPRDRAAADPGPRPDGGDAASRSTTRRWHCSNASSANEIHRLEQEIWYDVGHEFNLGSPKQLEQVLFYELNLPKGKRTKTGYSTDASVLEDLRPAHPIIGKLLDWRVYTKLRSTYVEALPTLALARRRPASTPRSTRPSPRPVGSRRAIRTCRTSRSAPSSGRRIRRAFVAGEPGDDPARRRLLADRVADPRPRVGRRAPEGGLRGRRGHPPRHGRARSPQGARRRHEGRALDGQDGQLRARLRHERLRALVARRDLAPGRAGVHQLLLRELLRHQLLHDGDQGTRAGPGVSSRRCSAGGGPSPSSRPATRPCAGRGSGWRSTCRSRARPRTS